MYAIRTLESYFARAATQFSALLLIGARQVGKTTLLKSLDAERDFVSLDNPLERVQARKDPELFLRRHPPPVLIDEVQYAPQLLPYIKMAVDAGQTAAGAPVKAGGYWLTGSQQFQLMTEVSEWLVGRVGILRLLSLSRQETIGQGAEHQPFLPTAERLSKLERQKGALSLQELYSIIWKGSLPAMALGFIEDKTLFYSSYLDGYLQRDVRRAVAIGDEAAFLSFMKASAARTGQLLNIADLSRDAGVSPVTGKRWLSILVSSGLVYLLEPYGANLIKRMIKAPKLFFMDTGLAAFLTGWASPSLLESGVMSGAILETWIMGELLKSWLHNGRPPSFYYFRDKDQREVDLLIVADGVVYPVEIKKTASPGRDEFRHFASLENLGLPIGPGCVICLADKCLQLDRKSWAVPVGLI
jgi:predicted AAA+ superfamily ATPase